MTMVTSPEHEAVAHGQLQARRSLATEPSSVHHQRTEKPCQSQRLRPLLNEKAMAMSTGTIDHTMYSHVMTGRTRGLVQGSRAAHSADLRVGGW